MFGMETFSPESLFDKIDISLSGFINQEKLHLYLIRLPGVFSSRDAEAIVDRVFQSKDSS